MRSRFRIRGPFYYINPLTKAQRKRDERLYDLELQLAEQKLQRTKLMNQRKALEIERLTIENERSKATPTQKE